MYEIALWEDSIVETGDDIMFAINIPQESVTIPETMDGVRACMGMQKMCIRDRMFNLLKIKRAISFKCSAAG